MSCANPTALIVAPPSSRAADPTPAIPVIAFCAGAGSCTNAFAMAASFSATSAAAGPMTDPMSMAASRIEFCAIRIRDSVVAYRFDASSMRAPPLDVCSPWMRRESVRTSDAPAIRSSTDAFCVPDRPTSVRTADTSPPDSLIRDKPSTNICVASTGDDSHCFAKSDALVPATSANAARSSPPARTAECISIHTRCIAPPPSSDSIPTDDMALDTARTSPSVAPMRLPTPARRCAMDTMSASVDAPALPSATRVSPSISYPATPSRDAVPMTLLIFARLVAASSAVRFVDSPSATAVSVNPRMSSRAMPSCPAASATPASSSWVAGSVFDRPRSPASSSAYCWGVPSMVFVTPAHADSHWIASRVASPRPAARPPPTTRLVSASRS